MDKVIQRWISLCVISTCIIACSSSPTGPAPVVSLDMTIAEEPDRFGQDTYKVQAGDTLFAIAWYSGNDYRDIARFNNLSAPYTIHPGEVLRLTAPTAPPVVKTAPAPRPKPPPGRTSTVSDQTPVDPPADQAYGESEKNVNRQEVRRQFPTSVERWVWPAEGEIIGRFSSAESGNKGVDIQNASGTPIVAAASGKVVYTGEALRGYGRLVIIKHTDTFLSAYAHNDRILVEEQQWVDAGEQIGTMGSTGTNSVKLHFEVRYRGKSLDPMRYLPRQ
ncbi:peptidoglycan DD-metalloendopeptidase family protein [Alteromonas sp. ASW11-36]|uniref:Peptidoglycan DD-metalloendopeptidase family protein n=1 Tax=Alteromonas arenosi TaxID=3055817 RepID=A0ABT7T1I8_9ALTE|nr:peptidoglycan DD-metalloendopeptidase family protein [Alteromonas sp. ASW11-36]MDM7861662.1 peptidoglycan DD-metalloendopeptidase family protein [Alteromonas sp. ASW11-36]